MRQLLINKEIKNGLVVLDGKDFRYLRQVLRARPGDMINVRLADGSLKNATLALVDDKNHSVTLQLCADTDSAKSITRGVQASEIEGATVSATEYWLFQFLPRPQKFEQIVRQAAECGVSVIIPVIGEYTEKSSATAIQGAKRERLDRIIKEARQQSGSPIDTKVLEPMGLEEAVKLWNASTPLSDHTSGGAVAFVLSERDDCDGNLRKGVEEAASKSEIKRAAIAVGSEGGISPAEVSFLQEKGLFTPIHFAVNILRCETAALYGIAAVQNEINESQVGKNGNNTH